MRGLCQFLVGLLLLATLAGCGLSPVQRDERAAWRGDAERRCLAAGYVRPSATKVAMREINGAGACGMERPFKVSALTDRNVAVRPAAVLACPAIAYFEAWVNNDIQPAAMMYFGQAVVEVQIMSSYSCRRMNGARTGKISEHAFGNGIDVGGFVLENGREVKVVSGWKGPSDEQGFLRRVYAQACDTFTTVLAPGSNAYHYNHIHVDLARHDPRGRKHYCRPKLAPQSPVAEPLIASAPQPASPVLRQLGPPEQQMQLSAPPMPESYPEAPAPQMPTYSPVAAAPAGGMEQQMTPAYPTDPELLLMAPQPTSRQSYAPVGEPAEPQDDE
jgi:hypothetical protein